VSGPAPSLFTAGEVDVVGAADKAGNYYVLDRAGKLLWATKLTPGGHHGGVMGSPAYSNGMIYVCSVDYTTDMTLGGRMSLWNQSLGGSTAGGVSISDGMLFVSWGWDWVVSSVNGGVLAYGLP
jgi:outer membrane protein assembly factor BamB